MRTRGLRSPAFCLPTALMFSAFLGLAGCSTPETRAIDVLRATNSANDEKLAAVRTLQSSGKEAVLKGKPELIQVLGTSTGELQRAAEEALTLVGSESAGDLIKVVEDPQRRPSVLRILRQTNAAAPQIQQVDASAASGGQIERLHAAEVLGALSVKNQSALTGLKMLMSDSDPFVRLTAIDEVTDLEPSNKSALTPALIRLLDDQSIGVREAACIGLGNIGPPAIEAKGVLERLTRGRDERLAELARIALSNITEGRSGNRGTRETGGRTGSSPVTKQ
jgi:HEAT repeat protein